MGSVGSRGEVKLPTIKLDTTLADLYRRAASPENANKRLAWISCGVSSSVDLAPDFPRNTTFVYEDQALITTPNHQLSNGNKSLRWSLAKKYLGLIPQRDAFITGAAPVVLFNLAQTTELLEHDRREAEATMSVLDPSQRPELVFCSGPSKIPMKEHGIDMFQYKIILDGLQDYPLTHDVETHWQLNSKATLARSGLPTPKSQIIETEGCPPAAESCCSACREAAKDDSRLPTIPSTCTGPRGEWLARETARVLDAVRARPVPFVFKTQQAFGGAGTWLVTSDDKKAQLLADLSGNTTPEEDNNTTTTNNINGTPQQDKQEKEPGLLRKLLPLLNPSNTHLQPTTTLLTDLIPNPSGDYGLTFFVTSSGEAIFLAAAEQMLTTDGSSAWIGSTIHYARQEALKKKFGGLMERIARWVAGCGYVGPVGADVLCSSSSSSEDNCGGEGQDEDGAKGCYIVDLNVRTSGSVSLPLLKGHFTSRGMGCASSFSIGVKSGRREFVERWRGPFEEGRMLILSWYEDPIEGGSIADVVVGGEDEERLAELMREVREDTEEVTF